MDKKTRIRHIIYYLLITFLLPIPFLIGVKFTHNEIIKTILYGIEIASPSIAAFTMLIIERRFKEFFKEGFRKDKLLVSLLLPIGLVIVTSFLAKLLSLIFCHDLKLFGELTGIQVLIIIYTLIYFILCLSASSPFNMVISIYIPCSVNTLGILRLIAFIFAVAFCDHKS